jgi:hypothetical protein
MKMWSLVAMTFALSVSVWAFSKASISQYVRAGEPGELRLWLEPAEVKTEKLTPITFKVMAEYESRSKTLPALEVYVKNTDGVNISRYKFSSEKPFNGIYELGNFEATTLMDGDFDVEIDENTVYTGASDLKIVTAKAKIWQ